MMTEQECRQLFDEWYQSKLHHSFHHTMCKGKQYEKLLAAGDEIVPFLLEILKNDYWMGLQGLLRDITHEDIWAGEVVAPGWRGYKVSESAERWLEWGRKKGSQQFPKNLRKFSKT